MEREVHIVVNFANQEDCQAGDHRGEVCTDSPVHRAPFTRTSTGITLVVSHNVNNVHVSTYIQGQHHKSKSGLLSSKSPLSVSTISASKTSKNILGGGGSSMLLVQFI